MTSNLAEETQHADPEDKITCQICGEQVRFFTSAKRAPAGFSDSKARKALGETDSTSSIGAERWRWQQTRRAPFAHAKTIPRPLIGCFQIGRKLWETHHCNAPAAAQIRHNLSQF